MYSPRNVICYIAVLLLFVRCTNESFTGSFDEVFYATTDTLRFDTVFTVVGSVTQTIKLFNRDNTPLRIESIKLGGGIHSPFKLNINGKPGPMAEAFSIPAHDSIYIFVSVRIDPTSTENPFLVRDSIEIKHAQKTKFIQLSAYGQHAVYLKHERIKTNTTWNAKLPVIIQGSLVVEEGAQLTMEKGSRIYVHASAPIIIEGTLKAIGTKKDSICFRGDRLDKDYRELPGSWPGIYFRNSSKNNTLHFVQVQHAYQGIVVGRRNGTAPNLTIDQSIIDHCYETGLLAEGSFIKMTNTLIRNCGANIVITGGGEYDLNHCTIVAYSTPYIPHKNPVFSLANWDSTTSTRSFDTKVSCRNSVLWGESNILDDEILISKKGHAVFDMQLENCLYKSKTAPLISGSANMVNQPPLFDSIDTKGRHFDFRIQKGRSPLINKGKPTGILVDLEGKPRDNQPDIGCYEKQ